MPVGIPPAPLLILGYVLFAPMIALERTKEWTANKIQTTRINWAIERSDASFIESCDFNTYSKKQLKAFFERAEKVHSKRVKKQKNSWAAFATYNNKKLRQAEQILTIIQNYYQSLQ